MSWTVGRRILAGFSAILALALLLVIGSVLALRATAEAFSEALAQERDVTSTALLAESSAQEANIAYLRFLLDPRPAFLTGYESAAADARNALERLSSDAVQGALWADALDRLAAWEDESAVSIAAAQEGDPAGAQDAWEEGALTARLALRTSIEEGLGQARLQGDRVTEAAREAAERLERRMWIMTALALLVGTLSAWFLNRAITGPLRETSAVLASSAAEILAATTQQASSASETSAAVAETSTTVDEVTETSRHATEQARSVAESARRSAEIGRKGRKAVDDSAVAMSEVQTQVGSIAESIVALAEQAQAIGAIISTVNDVAEQTNLLALNAAVEAARAGEHGRGFAVVAGEVRSLADQSKRATVQVREILSEIQAATNAAVMTTERGSHQVAAGARQVVQAGETIRELADAVADNAQAAAQIVASAGEQAAGMSQIRTAMGHVQEATQQTLASTRQAESAAKDLDRLGGALLDLVGRDGPRLTRGRTPAHTAT